MSRQYLRKISVIIGNDQEAIELASLRCVFKIKQWNLQTPNNLDLIVYNVAPKTEAKAISEFTRVVVQAGYEGGRFGTIFEGSIVQSFGGRENQTDTFLRIVAADGDLAYNRAIINQAFAAGTTPKEQWAAVAAAMAKHGVDPGYMAEPASSAGLPRGKVVFGMARDHARHLADANGQAWSIQSGRLQVLPKEGYLPGPAVELTSETGLVGLPERTQEGIKLRCLMNPMLKVGSPIHLNTRSIQQQPAETSEPGYLAYTMLLAEVRLASDGFYRVMVVEHFGDSRGKRLVLRGHSHCVEGLRAADPSPQRPGLMALRRKPSALGPVLSVWIDLAFPRQTHSTPALAPTPPVQGAGHAA